MGGAMQRGWERREDRWEQARQQGRAQGRAEGVPVFSSSFHVFLAVRVAVLMGSLAALLSLGALMQGCVAAPTEVVYNPSSTPEEGALGPVGARWEPTDPRSNDEEPSRRVVREANKRVAMLSEGAAQEQTSKPGGQPGSAEDAVPSWAGAARSADDPGAGGDEGPEAEGSKKKGQGAGPASVSTCAGDADCPPLAGGCLLRACVHVGEVAVCRPVWMVCQCLPGQAGACDDGDVCTQDTCNKVGGCVFEPLDCGDGDECSADSCDASVGCVHAPIHGGPCEDGSVCTIESSCEHGVCEGQVFQSCDDGDPCTWDGCDPKKGCEHKPVEGIFCGPFND